MKAVAVRLKMDATACFFDRMNTKIEMKKKNQRAGVWILFLLLAVIVMAVVCKL